MLLRTGVNHSALIVEVAVRHIVVELLVAAAESHAVALSEGGATHSAVEPVDAGTVAVVGVNVGKAAVALLPGVHTAILGSCAASAEHTFVIGKHKFLGGEGVEPVGEMAPAYIRIERNGVLAVVFAAALGGDHHNAVGASGTVDGCGGSILEHVD